MSSCEVRLEQSGRSTRLRVAPGTSLLEAATAGGLPLARACAGQGLCGRCGLRVLEGANSLSVEAPEERIAKQRNRVDPRQRLACCARIGGTTAVSASYW